MAKKPADRSILERLLRATVGALDKQSLNYILDYGGALGLARDGDLIPWDTDLDLSLPIDSPDWEARIRAALRLIRRRGFVVRVDWSKGRVVVSDRGVGIDLFFWRWTRKGRWERVQVLSVDQKFGKGTGMQKEWLTDTRQITFLTAKVCVPVDLEGLVAHRYGPDWRTPRAYFDEQAEAFREYAQGPAAPDNECSDDVVLAADPPSPDPVEPDPETGGRPLYDDLDEIDVGTARRRCSEHGISYRGKRKAPLLEELRRLRA